MKEKFTLLLCLGSFMAPAYAKSESSEKTQKLEQISVSDQTDLLNLEKIFSDLSSQKKGKKSSDKKSSSDVEQSADVIWDFDDSPFDEVDPW